MPPEKSKLAEATFGTGTGISISKGMLIDIIIFLDLLLISASAILIKLIYVNFYLDDAVSASATSHMTYLTVIAAVTLALYLSLMKIGYYDECNFDSTPVRKSFSRLAYSVFFSFGFGVFIMFLSKESEQFSRFWFVGWCAASLAILFFSRIFWSRRMRSLASKGYLRRRVFVLGSGEALQNVLHSFSAPGTGISLDGAGDVGASSEPNFEPLDTAIAKCRSGQLDEIVIALPAEDKNLAELIIRKLRLLPLDIKLALDYHDCAFKLLDVSEVGGANIASVHKKPISGWNVVAKMVEDYTLATAGVILFLPAMMVIALAIKLDGKGPVLFRQRRHGWNHEIIEVLKFRTMTEQEDGAEVPQATRNDKRVTKVGRFLRRTSLDELPQLFNVLKGDMSLVGPRPHALSHNDHYSKILEDYACRHRVKPGITGWAQINGFRGETAEPEMMMRRVKYDLEYIENWSIPFDLEILFMTPLYGFISKHAY